MGWRCLVPVLVMTSLLFPVCRGTIAPPQIVDCSTDADNINGDTYSVECPAGCLGTLFSIYGTGTYTSDSSICRAAIHDGRLTDAGGVVMVVETAGLGIYQGSDQNGITSNSWGSWDNAFYFVDSPTPPPTNGVPQICGGSLNQTTGNITSPNWPDLYEPLDSCEWLITAPAEGYVTLNFLTFNLTGSIFGGDSCQLTDTVTVYDGNSTDGDVIATLCATRPPSGVLRSSGRHMFVTFRAQRVGRYPGFFAIYNAVSPPVAPADCSYALGLENGHIKDAQLSASSQLPNYEAWKARLNGGIAWQFNVSYDREPWLQVNLTTNHFVSGVQTQGKWGGWLTSYVIKYSIDGFTWSSFEDGKVFPANSDGVNISQHILNPPIFATYLRIYPLTWNGNVPRLRMELLGCISELSTMSPTSSQSITSPLVLETTSGAVPTHSVTETTSGLHLPYKMEYTFDDSRGKFTNDVTIALHRNITNEDDVPNDVIHRVPQNDVSGHQTVSYTIKNHRQA
ncbi:neuropilin-2-like [Branchiostoma floridae x Branchiostoma japonicum]